MASIKKAKKALKREIRRIDEAIIELSEMPPSMPKYDIIWDLSLYRAYFMSLIKDIDKAEKNPWTGEGVTRFSLRESEQRDFMNLINGTK